MENEFGFDEYNGFDADFLDSISVNAISEDIENYQEDPVIDDTNAYEEDDFLSSSAPLPEPENEASEPSQSPSKDENGFDAIMLDRQPKKAKKKASEAPKDKEKVSEISKKNEDKKEVIIDTPPQDAFKNTTLPDSELKTEIKYSTENPSVEEKPEVKEEEKQEPAPKAEKTEEKASEDVSETVEDTPENEVKESFTNQTGNVDNGLYYEEPYEEPFEISMEEIEKENAYRKFFSNIKNVAIFAAMIFVLIGIPLLFSFISHKSGKKDDEVEKAVVTEVSTETTTEIRKSKIKLGEGLEDAKNFDDVKDKAYDSMTETNVSSRFNTLDELTFYLESNMASTLSLEKVLATQYKNGTISRDYFTQELRVQVDYTDTLNHLLTINKQTYKDSGEEEEYERLSDDMDALILYGDTLLYGGNTEEKTK